MLFLSFRSRGTYQLVKAADGTNQITVNAGDSLQAAIDVAKLGDTIILQAGATFDGPITLPNKNGGKGTDADYITIRTSDLDTIPKEGERLNPKIHGGSLPKIVAPSQQAAINTAAKAHHFRFIGIEIAPAAKSKYVYNLIDLGDSNYSSYDQIPHHLLFDRCYVHSTGLNHARRGFALNTIETSVINSHVSGFAGEGDETQAIAGWNGPGPFHIVNNYLEGGAEIILFGGADPSIVDLIPSDIEIRRNYFYRPAEWAGKITMKGTFELKNARRVVMDGNVLESTDPRQTAFVITVRNQNGKAPWSTIQDVEITNNWSRHGSNGVNVLGKDDQYPSQPARNIRIANNLFTDLTSPGDISFFVQIADGSKISIEHNTVQNIGNIMSAYGAPSEGLVFRDNIVQYNSYGIACFIQGDQCPVLPYCHCFPNPTIKGNVIADNENVSANYPIDKAFPGGNFVVRSFEQMGFENFAGNKWKLREQSGYRKKASDGKDPGVDFTAFEASGVYAAITGTAPRSR
jgi:hypothetical protein